MLWNAGQQRLARERQDRLAELFTAARDAALEVLVSTGQAKPRGTWRLPSYARPEQAPARRTPAERDLMLARLSVMFPGMVQTGGVQ